MTVKKEKYKDESYFHLSKKDRWDFDLEDKEKEEKNIAAEKVFEKLNKKYLKRE